MAADNEQRLVGKVIRDRDIVPALQRGVTDDWFLDDDNKRVWAFIRKHYAEYNEVPTATTVKDHYPNYPVLDVSDTIEYLLDTMVTFRRRLLTRQGVEEVLRDLGAEDHEAALITMAATVDQVNRQGNFGTHETDLSKTTEERYQAYLEMQNHEFLGIHTGFSKIDEATAGLQGGQLVTIVASPKVGKSQVALKMAVHVHSLGQVPMFQSFEMSNREVQQRYDSMVAHISHTRLRRGKLTEREEARYIDSLNEQETMRSFHTVDAINGLTVSALSAKISMLNPDVVFVDGVYLMLDEVTGESGTPQALTNITRSLKRLAQRIDKPIVSTTQALLWKMKGTKLAQISLGYSSSFLQDSDVILGLEVLEEDDEVRLLKILASRNCPPSETTLTWRWETGCFHDESDVPTCTFCTSWGTR